MQDKFINELSHKLIREAAAQNAEFVMYNGALKKGKWIVGPNNTHLFTIDNQVVAGPSHLINKRPEEIGAHEWEPTSEQDIYEPKPGVTKKYMFELQRAREIAHAKKRAREVAKIESKMQGEDAHEGALNFLRGGAGEPNSKLNSLAKEFAAQGVSAPPGASHEQQIDWLQKRLGLLDFLHEHVGDEEAQEDIGQNLNHYFNILQRVKKEKAGKSLSNTPDTPEINIPEIKTPKIPESKPIENTPSLNDLPKVSHIINNKIILKAQNDTNLKAKINYKTLSDIQTESELRNLMVKALLAIQKNVTPDIYNSVTNQISSHILNKNDNFKE